MKEYNGRINVLKDTMLFVTNSVFGNKIKESTTKESILKMMPKIYEKAPVEKIIRLLPYKSYKALEKLIAYTKENPGNDITDFIKKINYDGVRHLEEAMIIILRANRGTYRYYINEGILEKLEKLYTPQNRKLAERYGKIENLTIHMLYAYGLIEYKFFKTQICRFMNEIISENELEDLFFERLTLNIFVDMKYINWSNINEKQEFVTYLDDADVDIGWLANEQKNRGNNYKIFSEKQLLKREEYYWNENAENLFKYISTKNKNLFKTTFEQILKRSELGDNVLEILGNKCNFASERDLIEFTGLYMEWYNNSPQYALCGYTPVELAKKLGTL